MKELDNIKISDLVILLNEDTTLKRFYPLIPIRDELVEKLLNIGIEDKYMLFSELDKSPEVLANRLHRLPDTKAFRRTFSPSRLY